MIRPTFVLAVFVIIRCYYWPLERQDGFSIIDAIVLYLIG